MTPLTTANSTPEERARELLDKRLTTIRRLATTRNSVNEATDQLVAAENDDAVAYAAALKDGWTTSELAAIGFTEAKKPRPRRRPKPSSTSQSSAGQESDQLAS